MHGSLEESLNRSEARVVALTLTGAAVAPLPAHVRALGPATEVRESTPLNLFAPSSLGRVVATFELAKRRGEGSAVVDLADEDEPRRLSIFNLENSDNCMIAVIVPTVATSTTSEKNAVRPRQSEMTMSADGVIIGVDESFVRMFGYRPDEVIGRSSLEIIHPDDHEAGILNWVEVLETPGAGTPIRQRLSQADGSWLWCESVNNNHLSEDPPCVPTQLVDVSAEMEAVQALQLREALLDRLQQALPTGVLHLDLDGSVGFSNPRWTELTGADSILGIEGLVRVVDNPDAVRQAVDAAQQGADVDLAVELTGPGASRFGELHFRRLEHAATPFGLLITFDDVTHLRLHQMELSTLSRTDRLTGVLNRLGIEEALADRLDDPDRHCTVLFLDLDDFKDINDSHGHHTGDAVIRDVARLVQDALRPEDTLGRLGGDEFLAVLDGPLSDEQLEVIRDRVEMVGGFAARQSDLDADVGLSVGAASAIPGDTRDTLLQRADQAMYERKRSKTRPSA